MGTVNELADEMLALGLSSYPISATLLGFHEYDERLPDHTTAGEAALRDRLADVARRADALDPASLTGDERVTRAVVLEQARATIDRIDGRLVEFTLVDNFSAPYADLLIGMAMITLAEPAQADAYLARLRALPGFFETLAERHRAGVAAGLLPVRRLVEASVAYLDRCLENLDSDPLRRPAPTADSGIEVEVFNAERDRLLDEVVRPALARYRDVLADEIAPAGRPDERPGLTYLPGGDDLYAKLIRGQTTTDRGAEELHRTGLELMARLDEEYVEIGGALFGSTDAAEIREKLRTDPSLRWTSAEELLDSAREAIVRAEELAPQWFGKLPSQRCVVEAVPEDDAPGASGAYYFPPAIDGSRPGTYFANTYKAEERDRYASEATAYHEAVPGHHFQLTLAQELTDLPLLRRVVPFTAYSEGWGLYTERLADEMGLYSDAISRLGMLSMDSLRASRLVVDTGLHAMGWSRQQAIDYMLANTGLPAVEVENEVDRYIADPGQALAYMVGRLEIQRIRARSEEQLGERFDIRSFHDTVLCGGAMPLGTLDEVVQEWVREMQPSS